MLDGLAIAQMVTHKTENKPFAHSTADAHSSWRLAIATVIT